MPRLLRNKPGRDGLCKYALIRLDKLTDQEMEHLRLSADQAALIGGWLEDNPELLEFGLPHDDDEFFAIKLKDKFSRGTLLEYAHRARSEGEDDLASEVEFLADRAGARHRACKIPD